MKICQENGISCPLTKMDDETLEEYLSKVDFPLALKPRQGRGSVGFKKVKSCDELYSLISEGVIKVEEYVIQEFVEEAETHRVSYTFIDDEGMYLYDYYQMMINTMKYDGSFGKTDAAYSSLVSRSYSISSPSPKSKNRPCKLSFYCAAFFVRSNNSA